MLRIYRLIDFKFMFLAENIPFQVAAPAPSAPASTPAPSAKDALAAYEDTIVKAFAETLYR